MEWKAEVAEDWTLQQIYFNKLNFVFCKGLMEEINKSMWFNAFTLLL